MRRLIVSISASSPTGVFLIAAGFLEQLAGRDLEFIEGQLAILVGVNCFDDGLGEHVAQAEAAFTAGRVRSRR